jgi:hypothetical protein
MKKMFPFVLMLLWMYPHGNLLKSFERPFHISPVESVARASPEV